MNHRFTKPALALLLAGLMTTGTALAGQGNGQAYGAGDGSGNGNGGPRANSDSEWAGDPANRMARMSAHLGLSEEQEDMILEFFREQESQRQALHDQIMADYGAEICAHRDAQRDAFDVLLQEVLDPVQYNLHLETVAQRSNNRAARRHGRGFGNLNCADDN